MAVAAFPGSDAVAASEVNEYLEMDISQLMNIMVTSASKRAQSLSDVPAAIFVITQEDIRRSGVTSIPEALAMAPGIQVNRINGYRWSVASRGFPGFNSTKLLILIDERSLYSPGYSGTFWDSQNTMLEDVDRIEVIRGPGGTVWGANAVNGIINIITKSAKETQGALVRVGMGSQGMFTSAARYGAKLGEESYGRFYLSYDDYPSNTLLRPDITTGSLDASDNWRRAQGGFRIEGKANDRAEWTVQGDLLRNKEENLVSPNWLAHAPYLSSLYDNATVTRSNLLGRWHQDMGQGRALTLQSYIDLSSYDMEKDRFKQVFNSFDLDLQYETPLGSRQNLVLGTGFRQTEIDFTSVEMLEFPDRNDSLYSAFLQDEITLFPDTLWLTLGSKYEHNEYSGSEWQPSAKLLWKPKPRHSLWGSVSRAVRTPTLLEQEGRITMGTYSTPWGDGRASLLALSPLVVRAEVNEFLDLDLAQLVNITVTSVAKREQSLSDAAAAVFVITQEDIRRSGVTTIADALAMAPGIQVAKISASKWSVSSRGFTGFMSNKQLVLIDGRSVYSPLYSGVFWDSQNVMLEDVERIEVIRGPGGTVWGANAVNGVINIITKRAEDTQGTLVRVGVGDQEPLSTAARYGGKISGTAYGRFYVMYNAHGANELSATGEDAGDDWQPLQSGFRIDGKPGTGKEWTLQGDIYRNRGNQIDNPYWVDTAPYMLSIKDDIDVQGGNLLGRWRQELSGDSALTIQAYFDNTKRDETLWQWQYDTIDLDLQYETRLGQRQRVTAGVGYRSVGGEGEPSFQISFPHRNDELYSVFLQDEINLVQDRLWLTLGSKFENNDYTGDEWQPSARLLYKPVKNHSLWASVSRAVVNPTVLEQQGRVTLGVVPIPPSYTSTTWVGFVGSPSVGSEELIAYEVGYRWQASPQLSFDLALFFNDYDELFTMVQESPLDGQLFWANGVDGTSHGVELSADWKAASWLSFNLAYSYLDPDFSPKGGVTVDVTSERYNEGSAQHQVSLRSSIELAENWRFNLWGPYVDGVSS